MRAISTKQGIYGMAVMRPEEETKRSVQASVRNARARLTTTRRMRPDYKYEVMRMFARRQLGIAMGLPALATVIAAIMALWIPLQVVAVWLGTVFAGKAIILALARWFSRQAPEKADIRRWQLRFMLAELIYGICWASLSAISIVSSASNTAPHVVAFVALVLMLSLRTMMAGAMASIVYMGTIPVTVAILFGSLLMQEPMFLALAGITACAQIYFLLAAKRLSADTLDMFELRSQKDSLIAELEQAKAISDEARRRAEEANIAKSRFLATMSHELRTPLNAILGFSEVMKAEILGPHAVPTYREYCEDIHRSGQHLLTLISEVLDLSRIEAGRYEMQEEAVNLAYVADDCMRLMELRVRERGITLEEQIEPNMPELWADERAIRQVCLNLLSNSIKFTPNGGRITVQVGWTEGGGQYLSVRDTGPGIPEEEIPQILTSFGQGALAQKTAEQGAGLGLPIVQGLVKLHGGSFDIKSKLREGTEVTIILPRKRVLQAAKVKAAQLAGAPAGAAGAAEAPGLNTAA